MSEYAAQRLSIQHWSPIPLQYTVLMNVNRVGLPGKRNRAWGPVHITLDPRLPFPDSVGWIFPCPATTQKVYQGIEWFSQLAATMNGSFEHVD